MDPIASFEIDIEIKRVEEIINTNIFARENSRHPLMKSAFIELLICLRDLMAKAEKYSSRVSFTDDVIVTSKLKDITDLVTFVRDCLCHIDSGKHILAPDQQRIYMNISYGKAIWEYTNRPNLTSDYEDDTCYFFGEQKIYFKRHILRAFDEAKKKLLPFTFSSIHFSSDS